MLVKKIVTEPCKIRAVTSPEPLRLEISRQGNGQDGISKMLDGGRSRKQERISFLRVACTAKLKKRKI